MCVCDQIFINVAILWEKLSQPQFYKNLSRKNAFFEGWSWFKFNNSGMALSTNLKFCTSVGEGLKLKVRKFWGLIPTFVEVAGEKLVGGGAFLPPSTILNRVKIFFLVINFHIYLLCLYILCSYFFYHQNYYQFLLVWNLYWFETLQIIF